MYDVIKIVIDAGGYSLPDVLGKSSANGCWGT